MVPSELLHTEARNKTANALKLVLYHFGGSLMMLVIFGTVHGAVHVLFIPSMSHKLSLPAT